jgi:hypothetical protein
MKYTPFIQTNLFTDLDELNVWLAGWGITQRNRLRIYRENLIAMRDREKTIGEAELFAEMHKAGRLTEVLASYVEGYEIVDALTCLRAGQVEIPDELLRRALDGAPDGSRESPKNNQGRNAMFELSIGAMLARENLKPKLSTGNPDLEFRFEDRRILVECKRVLSEDRTLPVISEGIRQLRKQVNPSDGEVGVVAVNISRVFYRGDGHWEAPANSDVREVLAGMIRYFIDTIRVGILRKKDPAATGAFFYAAAPFRVEGMGYTPARSGMFCAFDLNRDEFLARLASSLHL